MARPSAGKAGKASRPIDRDRPGRWDSDGEEFAFGVDGGTRRSVVDHRPMRTERLSCLRLGVFVIERVFDPDVAVRIATRVDWMRVNAVAILKRNVVRFHLVRISYLWERRRRIGGGVAARMRMTLEGVTMNGVSAMGVIRR